MERIINNDYYLVIDCGPFLKRPNEILENILINTKLNINDFKITSKSFGEWTFKLYIDKTNEYLEELPNIIEKLKNNFKNGNIRFAEYYPNN